MRLKLAIRNLIISQVIIFLFLIFAYFFWFPYSYTRLGGFYETAFMLILVDVVLGPLLIILVYKKGKKHLRFDINILLGIQLIAFVYGAYALYLKHPTYNVFINDRYKLVNASYSFPDDAKHSDLKSTLFSKPIMVYTELPKNETQLVEFILGVDLQGKPDIDRRADLYQYHSLAIKKILNQQLNKTNLFKSPLEKNKLERFLSKNKGEMNDYAFFPISGNNLEYKIFAINNITGNAVGIIDINPFLHNRI